MKYAVYAKADNAFRYLTEDLRFVQSDEDYVTTADQVDPFYWTWNPVEHSWSIDLQKLHDHLWEEAKTIHVTHRDGGCETPKGRMDSDGESRGLLAAAIATAREGADAGMLDLADFEIGWTMSDDTEEIHNFEELRCAGVTMGLFVSQGFAARRAVRDHLAAALAAGSEAALRAVDLRAGYP